MSKSFASSVFKPLKSFGDSSVGSTASSSVPPPLPPEDPNDLILEIVRCRDLLVEDALSSDPYVIVTTKGGRETFHKTKHIKRNLNPDYAPKHDNLIYVPSSYVDKDGGMRLELMDRDRFRSDEPLGSVRLPSESLRNAATGKTGGELTFTVRPPVTRRGENAGTITIRCRLAADFREAFRNHLRRGKKSSAYLGAHRTEDVLAPRKPPRSSRSSPPRAPPPRSSPPRSRLDGATSDESSVASISTLASAGRGDRDDLIVEIAYCRGLLKEDAVASDPYVIVHVEGGEGGGRRRRDKFHKTKFLFQTLNPEYTPKHDSLFYLPSSYLDSEDSESDGGGIILELKDHDTLGRDEPLGTARVSSRSLQMAPVTLRESAGEMTLDVTPPTKRSQEDAGRITIRCRPPTDFIEPFRLHLKRGKKSSSYPGARADTKLNLLTPAAPRDKPPPEVGARGLLTETVAAISTTTAKAVHGTAKVATKVATADVSAVCPVTKVVDRVHRTGSIPADSYGDAAEGQDDFVLSDGDPTPPTEPDDVVVEIASCKGLLAADAFSSDPYVIAKVGQRRIHATKYIKRTRNPTYTPDLDSLFYLSSRDVATSASAENDVDDEGGEGGAGEAAVLFKAVDFDKWGTHDNLGGISIPISTLREAAFRGTDDGDDAAEEAEEEGAAGEVTERLIPPPDRKGADAGSIVLRCRPASHFEEAFLDHLKRRKKSSKFPGIGSSVEETILRPPEERRASQMYAELAAATAMANGIRDDEGGGATTVEDGATADGSSKTDKSRKKKKKKKKKRRKKKDSRDETGGVETSTLSEPLLDDGYVEANERQVMEEEKGDSFMTWVCRRCCGFL